MNGSNGMLVLPDQAIFFLVGKLQWGVSAITLEILQ